MTTIQPLRFYNTYSRKVEEFSPLVPSKVGIYCCGPTVYNFQHIGNFKTFIFEDVLVRTLRYAGYDVRHVMNITDVGHLTGDNDEGEDKMMVAMRREGKSSFEIADYYTQKFFEDWDKLGLRRPDVVCKATDHIREMIELIKRIEAEGYAYVANGNVYFDVARFENYGKLALLDLEKLRAGARIDVDPHKRGPHDFVLWFTKSKFENQELQWDSPWGRGYPGWHIECSAMSMKYLGDEFDIHCGGIDHIPVHHTNEIAQSEAATGKPWVRVWMHSQFMLIDDAKMSKSTGKFLILDDLIQSGFDPAAYRLFVMSAHYRAHLNFNWGAMENAQRNISKMRSAVLALKKDSPSITPPRPADPAANGFLSRFSEAMGNDLNTPQALAVLWDVLSEKSLCPEDKLSLLYTFDSVLGIGIERWREEIVDLSPGALALLEKRQAARAAKNWAEADRYRDELLALGFIIQDSKDGPTLKKK